VGQLCTVRKGCHHERANGTGGGESSRNDLDGGRTRFRLGYQSVDLALHHLLVAHLVVENALRQEDRHLRWWQLCSEEDLLAPHTSRDRLGGPMQQHSGILLCLKESIDDHAFVCLEVSGLSLNLGPVEPQGERSVED